MDSRVPHPRLSALDLEAILGVTTALAQPFDLTTMLAEVVNAAKQVLKADRGSVWLYDPAKEELVLEVATGLHAIRVPATAGLAGACAQSRAIINVPDCYADPRFDPRVDHESGYRTRCMLTLPLIDHRGALVGVMQVLNKAGGVFDAGDETLAAALAAQCAVALQRVRMTEAPATALRRFPRRVDALPALFAFTAAFFAEHDVDAALLSPVDFAIEELFTNMVKYGRPGGDEVELALARIAGGVDVALTDYDVDPFDPTQAPDADVTLPIEQRSPGGLGIHLTRRLVEGLDYGYSPERREARITFRKTGEPAQPNGGSLR